MDGQNHLGIYISKDTATVVCLGPNHQKVIDCFTVSVEDQEQTNTDAGVVELVNLVARDCAQRNLQFTEVAVALDCALFMQHDIHSEFSDLKQIASTVRYDTEEALAIDVSDVAIAFKVISTDQDGSRLTVFTAQKKLLSGIINALQSNNLDPVFIEPDVNCLSRFVFERILTSDSDRAGTLFAMLSKRGGYFIIPLSDSKDISFERTLLIGPAHDRTNLLVRELPLTTAFVSLDKPINHLRVYDFVGLVDSQRLSDKLSVKVTPLDLVPATSVAREKIADCGSQVNFAIAYGAALTHSERTQTVDFRSDFMPFMGKKRQLQNTLKIISVSTSVVLVVLGLYFQIHLIKKNKPVKQLREKFAQDYSTVMLGKNLPGKLSDAEKRLRKEMVRIENIKGGQLSITGEKSISARLTMTLEAFNKVANDTDLSIEKITITAKNINIVGDTSNRSSTLKLLDALKDEFIIQQQRLGTKEKRDTFSVTIVPKQ